MQFIHKKTNAEIIQMVISNLKEIVLVETGWWITRRRTDYTGYQGWPLWDNIQDEIWWVKELSMQRSERSVLQALGLFLHIIMSKCLLCARCSSTCCKYINVYLFLFNRQREKEVSDFALVTPLVSRRIRIQTQALWF